MHFRLFSDFSHKHFVTYSQSVPKERRALLGGQLGLAAYRLSLLALVGDGQSEAFAGGGAGTRAAYAHPVR